VLDFAESLHKRKTLRQEAYDLVKRALLRGDIASGEIISANALASELGISNSPVREALSDLTGDGLLVLVKNRGFRVKQASETDRREIHGMRSILEVEAMRRLALRGLSSSEQSRALELTEISIAPLDEGRAGDYLDADHEFHMYLLSLLQNSRLSDSIGLLRDETRICGAFINMPTEQLSACSHEHFEIIDALVSQDVERIASLMQHHLEFSARMAPQPGPRPESADTSEQAAATHPRER